MYQVIKGVVDKCIDANNFIHFRVVKVLSKESLICEDGQIIPIDVCIFPKHLSGLTITVGDSTKVCHQVIGAGSILMLLQIGQAFIILGELGEAFYDKVI